MFCYKCGHELPENSKFCPKCGSPMPGAVKSEPTRSTPTAPDSNQSLHKDEVKEPVKITTPVSSYSTSSSESKKGLKVVALIVLGLIIIIGIGTAIKDKIDEKHNAEVIDYLHEKYDPKEPVTVPELGDVEDVPAPSTNDLTTYDEYFVIYDLIDICKNNAIGFAQKYQDKRICLDGVVQYIYSGEYSRYITIVGYDENGEPDSSYTIDCYLHDNFNGSILADVGKGKWITVVGSVDSVSGSYLTLRDCVVTAVTEDENFSFMCE